MRIEEIRNKLQYLSDARSAKMLQRFFKTGPGEYGAGDIFIGIRVPVLRRLAKEYEIATLTEVKELLHSSIHEERLLALLILIRIYQKNDAIERKRIYQLYLRNSRFINNWDLVDCSAEHIAGDYLFNKSKRPLYQLAKSKNLWERRISIISTFHFIKREHFNDTLKIAELLLNDKEDLIHKAVGWMLREVGKRNLQLEEVFLKKHCLNMPRTMLRYAIEKFPAAIRQNYLKGIFIDR